MDGGRLGSQPEITRKLNGEGIPSPTERGWGMSGVRELLRRPVYQGQLVRVHALAGPRWDEDQGRYAGE